MEKTDAFGTFMLDGRLIDIDKLSPEELVKMNKEFETKEIETREKINESLQAILK